MYRLLGALVLALLVAGCSGGGDSDPADVIATQAERVATLLEQGEDCRALEAAATLQTLADEAALDQSERAAATRWADQARQHLSCDDPTTHAPQTDDGAPAQQDDGAGDTDGDDDGDDGSPQDRGNEGDDRGNEGEDRDNGPPDDRGNEGDDRGNEGEGRGNGPPDDRGNQGDD